MWSGIKSFLKKIVVFVLTIEARLVLRRYRPKVVSITGSVGKTSTKDAVYAVLSKHAFVRKSEKSFNSEIGVPLTILGRPNGWNNPFSWIANIAAGFLLFFKKQDYPHWLVLEVWADRPGDIKKISRWLKSDIVVVTRFASTPVHIEFFGSKERVIEEKSQLVKALKPDGTLVLSRDDEEVYALRTLVRNEVLSFGFSPQASVIGSRDAVIYEGRAATRHPVGMSLKILHGTESATFAIKHAVGRQLLYAALAATAVGVSLEIKLSDIAHALSGFEGPLGRMRLVPGVKDTLIIDDTYNSSPIAAREALDSLAALEVTGRKIAVLGDMLELGKFSITEHKEIGRYAAKRVDLLVTVGVRSRDCAIGALESGMNPLHILEFDDAESAAHALEGLSKPDDVLLLKGSQGIRMEKAVAILMAEPQQKQRLLVRQENEWHKR